MRFGPFELDTGTRRVTRHGEPVHLTPKAFDLLVLLIDAAPNVVPKDDIHERLWPQRPVSDATLVGLIKELRRALDDTEPAQRTIRTAHRVGYAFDAPIDTDGPEPAAPASGLLVIGRRLVRLTQGDNLIGRDPACDVWIDDATVSRRHARIVVDAKCAALEDLGSKNGTRVGEEPLTTARELRHGDQIRFGGVDAVFRDEACLPTATRL